MQRIYNKLYTVWITISFVICGFIIIFLYPDYINNEFPLYTDFILVLFLPAFFIVSYLISHIFSNMFFNKKVISYKSILLIKLCFMLMSLVISLMFMEFRLAMRVIFSVILFIVSMPHFVITNRLYNKSLT